MSNRFRGWGAALRPKKDPKYGNQPTEYAGILYHSKREAEYAEELAWRERAGEVRNVRRQVRVDLMAASCSGESCTPSAVRYSPSKRVAYHVLDFVFEEKQPVIRFPVAEPDGTVSQGSVTDWGLRYVEVKGYDTPLGKLKRAIATAMLGVEIEVVK